MLLFCYLFANKRIKIGVNLGHTIVYELAVVRAKLLIVAEAINNCIVILNVSLLNQLSSSFKELLILKMPIRT